VDRVARARRSLPDYCVCLVVLDPTSVVGGLAGGLLAPPGDAAGAAGCGGAGGAAGGTPSRRSSYWAIWAKTGAATTPPKIGVGWSSTTMAVRAGCWAGTNPTKVAI